MTGACGVAGCGHDGRDPGEHGARFLDALVEGSRRLQTTDLLPESHGATPRLTLTMDCTALAHGVGAGTLDTGERLSGRGSATTRLRCGPDPGGARRSRRGPRRRPGSPPGDCRDLGGAGLAGPALHLPRLPTSADRLRRPPHHLLARRRRDQPGQPRVVVSGASHDDPHHPVGDPTQPTRPATRVPPTGRARPPAGTHPPSTTPRIRPAGGLCPQPEGGARRG